MPMFKVQYKPEECSAESARKPAESGGLNARNALDQFKYSGSGIKQKSLDGQSNQGLRVTTYEPHSNPYQNAAAAQ